MGRMGPGVGSDLPQATCAGYTPIPGTQSSSQEPDQHLASGDSIVSSPTNRGLGEGASRELVFAVSPSMCSVIRTQEYGLWLLAYSTSITALTGSHEKVSEALPANPESS